MIQISNMSQYWIIAVFLLLLLKPLFSFAEGKDPFDNTILTFEDNIQTTVPEESIANQEMSSQSNTAVALDQPINKRYPITRYSMQGLIKSANKTQMMFVAVDENVKFLLSINDCLGLNCGYVTNIDKRGRVTIEDEEGIYRFQVGYAPFILENKISDMLEESLEAMNENQLTNAEAEVTEQLSDYVDVLENEIAVLNADNLSFKSEIQILFDSNTVLDDEILFLNEQIQELKTSIPELQNTITTQEETINQKQANINQLQEELQNSTAKQDTTASSDSTDIENLQNTITSLNATLENKSKIINDGENKIAIQDKQIDSLQNNLDTILGDFNEKLNAKQELITNLESQLLAQSTTDATSSQGQNEQSTNNQVNTITQSTENVSETNDINGDNLMVAIEDVNIREMPSPNSSIIGVLIEGSTINVLDTVQGWHKIFTKEGKDGYISSPMLKEKN